MKRRAWKWLRNLVLGCGFVLLLLGGGLVFLLYSDTGVDWGLRLVRSMTPLQIEADVREGRLAGPLVLRGLVAREGELGLRIGELRFDWRPGALLRGDLRILELRLGEVALELPGGEGSRKEEAAFKGLSLPLDLMVDNLTVEGFSLVSEPGKAPLQVDRLHLVLRGEGDRIEVEALEFDAPGIRIEAGGGVGLGPELPLNLTLSWHYRLPQGAEVAGEGELKGDLSRLDLHQQLADPLAGELRAALFDVQRQPHWDAVLELRGSRLERLVEGPPLAFSGRLASRGNPDRIGLEADLRLRHPDAGDARLNLQGEMAGREIDVTSLRLATAEGATLEGQGRYSMEKSPARFEANLAWRGLRWPLTGQAAKFHSAEGSLKVEGVSDDYRYRLEMQGNVPGQPVTALTSLGHGNLEGLRMESLQASLPRGGLEGEGELQWRPALGWRFTLKGRGLDPGLWRPELPGELDLELATRGGRDETGLSGEVDLQRLQGNLRGYPLGGSGKANLAGDRLSIEALQILSGENRLQAEGVIGENLDLDWRLEGGRLEALWPGLEGRLKGRGRVSGSRGEPKIQLALEGADIAYGGDRLEVLELQGNLDLAEARGLDVRLRTEGLHTSAGTWQGLDLALTGTLPRHRIDLQLKGKGVPRGRLIAEAGWSEEAARWSGTLRELTLELPEQGRWRLQSPTEFSLAAAAQRLQPFCLAAAEAKLCGRYQGSDREGWRGEADLQAFPLKLLQPWLPPDLALVGAGELKLALRADAGGRQEGTLSLTLPRGRLDLDPAGDGEPLVFDGGRLEARLDDRGGTAELKLPLAGLGGVRGHLDLPALELRDLAPERQKVAGRLTADITDLSGLSRFSPQLQNVRGRLSGDFTLAGTLTEPSLQGSAELSEGQLELPALGLVLKEIALQLQAPALDRLALQGALSSGEGRLDLDGTLGLRAEAGFPLRLHLRGEALTAVDLPEAELQISPDVTLEKTGELTTLKGRVDIPYARIRPRRLPESAVTASPDLVVVEKGEAEPGRAGPQISSELRVTLGKRVSFDGFGLRGKLTGGLLIIDEPGRPVIGRGRLGVLEGSYRAYGQDLKIERGFALFADSPVENPGLDVRAVREIEEVTVGIRVGGTLKKPNLDLFSTPAMTETEQLSYLVTGHAPGEGGGQSVGLAAAMKASGAGTVAEELGRRLGLEELRLDAGNSLQEASVVAGTYLSPRLYLQYINELASRETKMRIRYDINKRLQLEAETGKSQAGDLYYTFDR